MASAELDAEGRVVGKTLLDWPHHDQPIDDGLDDLADEKILEPPSVLEPSRDGARLARRCRCEHPLIGGEAGCARCGYPLRQTFNGHLNDVATSRQAGVESPDKANGAAPRTRPAPGHRKGRSDVRGQPKR